MRFLRSISAWLLAATITVTFAGCGTGQSNPGGEEPAGQQTTQASQASTQAPDTVKAAEDITLTFTYWGSTYEKEVISKAIDKFVQSTGIKVEGIIIPSEYETKLTTMIASNDAPDAGYLGPPTAYKWYEDGKLANIKELFQSDTDSRE
jgi:multiple sugar transport system substrate-binding protein